MKIHSIYSVLLLCLVPVLAPSCSEPGGPGNIEPLLHVDAPTLITRTTAMLHGHVERTASTDLPELSFEVGQAGSTIYTSPRLVVKADNVTWTASALKAGETYYCLLKGRHGKSLLQSDTLQFTTLPNDKPSVTDVQLLSYGPTSVIVSFSITNTGGETVTSAGIRCTDASSGKASIYPIAPDSALGHSPRICIGPLRQKTNYEFTAFAQNKLGTTQSSVLSHTTGEAVVLTHAGDLPLLMSTDMYTHTTLAISGQMNGSDIRCLRQMMGRDADGNATEGQLTDADLTDVSIVAGGSSYGYGRYTASNVVGTRMFAGCNQLKRLLLPASATVVEKDALQDCNALQTLVIPASARQVTPSSGCNSLSSIQVSTANTQFKSTDGVLFNHSAQQIVWFPMGKTGSYTLPATVTTVGDYAFEQCHITRFVLPDKLTKMGQAVFYGSEVQEVTLPDELRLIPTATFQHCSKLVTVRLGKAAELVSDYVFDGCQLANLYVDAVYPPVCNEHAFTTTGNNIFKSCTLHVPAASLRLYKADAVWGKFAHIKAQ